MNWLILGLVLFFITFVMLRGTIVEVWDGLDKSKVYVSTVWNIIVVFLICLIPILNIVLFILFFIWYCVCFNREPKYGEWDRVIIVYNEKKLAHKVLKGVSTFLNKTI